jgi:hypothetical protein
MAQLKPMDATEIENIVSDAVDEAVDFVESEIAEDRIKAQRYFDGETDIGYEEGRSKVVSTKVRDTVRNIKPSLLRIFASSEKAVEFVPKAPKDVQMAEMATSYINWSFSEVGGFRLLTDAFHDALVKKQGVLKTYWDEYSVGEIYTYDNLTDEEFYAIANDPDVEILEHSEEIEVEVRQMQMPDGTVMDQEFETKKHELKISHTRNEGKLCVKSVPPEEFFVDRNATSLEDAYVVAHRTEMRVGDLVAMGYDFDEVSEFDSLTSGSTGNDMEIYERKGYMEDDQDESAADPSMKLVLVTEAYMKMDIEGTGVPMLYKFLLGGTNYELIDYELWDEIPFAVFEVDPEPHAFYGRSIADLVINDQDAATAMLRGILDNVALTNNPRLEVQDDMVNIDDLLNNEIGAVVRVRQNGAVQPLAVPFVAGSTLPALQYLDQLSEVKTGVSRASLGLDPDVLQNTSATAAKLAQNGGQGQIEVISRNLAESGLRRLFKLMLKLLVKNSPEQQLMRLNGQFIPVDPRAWNTSMDVTVNVGLGTGQEDMKLATLNQALQTQLQLATMPNQLTSLTSMTQIRNTLADILALGGYNNAERYFRPMDQQTEQQIMQQIQAQQAQAQAQQGQANPAMAQAQALIQAEQIKAQTKMQTDAAKLQLQAQTDAAKLQNEQQAKMAELEYRRQTELDKLRTEFELAGRQDDLDRDQMNQDLLLRATEILGKYGTEVEVERIRAMQQAPRDGMGNI